MSDIQDMRGTWIKEYGKKLYENIFRSFHFDKKFIGIREKEILKRLGSARIFYKSKFPVLFSVGAGWRKARESLIYKNSSRSKSF